MDFHKSQEWIKHIKVLKEQSEVIAEIEIKKYVKAEANTSPEYQKLIDGFAKKIFIQNLVEKMKAGLALDKEELIFSLESFDKN